MHGGHVGCAAGSNKWAYALRSGVCPERWLASRTAPCRFEEALQSITQGKFSYTMAIRGLLGEGSMIACQWVLVVVAAALTSSLVTPLPGLMEPLLLSRH